MPYSNKSRRKAALGKSIRSLYGEDVYLKWKQTGIVPPGLQEARRRNKYKYRGGSLPNKHPPQTPSTTRTKTAGLGKTNLPTRPVIAGAQHAASLKASARKIKLQDVIGANGVLNENTLSTAFPDIHSSVSNVNRRRIARSVASFSSSHPNGDSVFRALRNAYLSGPQDLNTALTRFAASPGNTHIARAKTAATKKKKSS